MLFFVVVVAFFLRNKGVLKRSKDFIFIYLKRSKESEKEQVFEKEHGGFEKEYGVF